MTEELFEIPWAHVERPIRGGYVDHWLLAGPYRLAKRNIGLGMLFEGPPAERRALPGASEGDKAVWQMVSCADDHLVHLASTSPDGDAEQAWLYSVVQMVHGGSAYLEIVYTQPISLWLNRASVLEAGSDDVPAAHSMEARQRIPVTLLAGQNEILIRTQIDALGPSEQPGCWYAGVRLITEAQEDLHDNDEVLSHIVLPSILEPLERREALAAILADAYVEQDLYQGKEHIWVKWPPTTQHHDTLTVRLQSLSGRIYAEAYAEVTAGSSVRLSSAGQLRDDAYEVVVMPKPEEYYVHNMRVQRRIPIRTLKNTPSTIYYGDYAARQQEALADAARRSGLYAEIAKMASGQWAEVEGARILDAVARVYMNSPENLWKLLGLLGMMARFGQDRHFEDEWSEEIADCVLQYDFGASAGEVRRHAHDTDTEINLDVDLDTDLDIDLDNETLPDAPALGLAAVAILAGQLWPEEEFGRPNCRGTALQQAGEQAVLRRLRACAQQGFQQWDAPDAFKHMVAALSHLVDLAEHEEVVDLAAVVLDKLFLTLGINSFQGVFGSTHATAYGTMLTGRALEPTAGLARLAWGKGTFNEHVMGTVSLACAQAYSLPEIIAATAVDATTELWHRERHATVGPDGTPAEVHKATYKNSWGMLCSVQDYFPGQPGHTEHCWQATLGPGAVVFVNHPAYSRDCESLQKQVAQRLPKPELSETNDRRREMTGSGFWAGNGLLPRVGQVEDFLAAWYRLPADDRMGFTHAYFPRHAFDEHAVGEQWAFARKGSGYVALFAHSGLLPILQGGSAHRELRAAGPETLWLCQLGNEVSDGSFAEFKARMQALEIEIQPGQATMQTLRGRHITFGWEGPLLVDGSEWPLRYSRHYESEFCRADFPCEVMEVMYKGHAMRLALGIQAAV